MNDEEQGRAVRQYATEDMSTINRCPTICWRCMREHVREFNSRYPEGYKEPVPRGLGRTFWNRLHYMCRSQLYHSIKFYISQTLVGQTPDYPAAHTCVPKDCAYALEHAVYKRKGTA